MNDAAHNSPRPCGVEFLWLWLIGLSLLNCACTSVPDTAAERHAKAVKALIDFGADVRDVDDEIAQERGTFVFLFAEHITREGRIEDPILTLLQDVQSCFLGLSNTPVKDAAMPDIARLLNVKLVNLHNTPITDQALPLLAKSHSIRLLKLTSTKITNEGLQALTALNALRMLYLSDTYITDEGLRHLERLPQLEALKLSRVPVTDVGLESLSLLPRLRYLGLDGTVIGAAGLDKLEHLPSLTYLDVSRTVIPENAIKAFRERHPKCHIEF